MRDLSVSRFWHGDRILSAVGWLISLLCIALIAWKIDLHGAAAALKNFQWRYLLLGLASLGFGWAIKIVRWNMMLRASGTAVTAMQCAAPYLGAVALNNVLPLRAGDIIRATVFPGSIGVPRTDAIGSIVMERLVDLLTLLLCLAIGVGALGASSLPNWLKDGALFLTCLAVIALFAIVTFSGPLAGIAATWSASRQPGSLFAKLLNIASAILSGFRQMSKPRILIAVSGLSLFAWAGEAGLYWSVLAGFAIDGNLQTALLVMAFVSLSTLVPSSPGYVGPFHVAAISILVLLGVGQEAATSFAILSHLLLWVSTTLAGGLAMLVRPDIFRGALSRERRAKEHPVM